MKMQIGHRLAIFLLCIAALFGAPPDGAGAAEPRTDDPLWEAGVFLGAARIPAYKGSDEYESYAFPFPYFVYRGEVLSVDREHISGRLFRSDRLELDTSVYVEFNRNDEQRSGMAELHPVLLAAGPALKVYFRRQQADDCDLYLEIPLRAAVSGDIDGGLLLKYRGLQSKINLFYKDDSAFESPAWDLTAAVGVAIFNSDLAAYYYTVDPPYATAGRPEFDAGAGYAGASGSLDLQYHFTHWLSIRGYLRVDSLHGAVFEDSPLVRDPITYAAGVAVIFKFWESQRRASR
jgi:outer membrane scaffolding protein for murein synthesis (MipA/OmpV family)